MTIYYVVDSISGKAIDKVVSKAPLGGTRLGAKASSLTKGMASGMVTCVGLSFTLFLVMLTLQ